MYLDLPNRSVTVYHSTVDDGDGIGQHSPLSTGALQHFHGRMFNVAHIDSENPMLGMQDDLGIVYLIDSAQQFWSGACFFGRGAQKHSRSRYYRVGRYPTASAR